MKKASFSRAIFAFAATVALSLILPSLASALSFQETAQSPLPEMTGVNDIATGYFNTDSDADMAVAAESGVVIWLSDGDGTFTKGQTLPIEANPGATATAVVAGDFNDDGKEDLAYSDGSKIYLALGNGDGTFTAPDSDQKLAAPFYLAGGQLAVGDFNEDGKDDLAITGGIHNSSFTEAGYEVFTGNSSGTLTPLGVIALTIPVNSQMVAVAAGDYNNDGAEDLALLVEPFEFANYADNQVLGEEGEGDGTFTAAAGNPISLGFTEGAYVYGEATANLDGSGGDDLLVTASKSYETIPLLGSSSDFLSLNSAGALTSTVGLAFRVTAADLDGDGLDEAIPGYFDGRGSVGVGISDGSGNLTAAKGSPFRTSQEHFFDSAVAVGDFNGDGYPDIAVGSNANTNGDPLTQGVAVMINSPGLGVEPEELEFGSTLVGETVTKTVTLTGLGAPGTEVSEVELSGSPDSPFSIVEPEACETLAYEEECEIEVEYTPTSNGESSDTLSITADDGPDGSDAVATVPLSGRGLGPEVTLSPASQNFGSAEVGGAPVVRTFQIESTGVGALTVTGVSLSSEADFKLTSPSSCIRDIGEGQRCAVKVSFSPVGATGSRAATLTIETNAGDPTASLTGVAEAAHSSGGEKGGPTTKAPAPTAKLKLKAPATVEAGKQVKLKVQVTNTGESSISGLTLTTKVPKSLAKAAKPVKIASLAAGRTVTRTIEVKVKGSAAGKKLKLTVTATAAGTTLAKSSRKIKVK